MAYFDSVDAFGEAQFAFRKGIGCHDFLLILFSSRLIAFQPREKVGSFMSDIAGAFDRVDAKKLLTKLRGLGVCEPFLDFIASYVQDRAARVAVDRAESAPFALSDVVIQGTVLGLCSWNVFFADVRKYFQARGSKGRKFADDMNTSKCCDRSMSTPQFCTTSAGAGCQSTDGV